MAIIEHLIADTFGTHIGKYSKRLKITQGGETLAQAPLMHLKSVLVSSRGVSVSADTLEACCERGIPIFFLDSRGQPYASIYTAGLTGTVVTRRAQLLAYYDMRGADFARACAWAKIHNQSATLKYLAKNRKETPIYTELKVCAGEVLDVIRHIEEMQADCVEDCRAQIMAYEGNAASRYWSAAALILPEEYAWPGRVGRGAQDPLNSLLNYGYGILYGHIEQAIILAGLDPYAGFLHADRPGKPSLVLDLIEEFRQVAVDRVVFGLAARHYKVEQDDCGRLGDDLRRDYAQKILSHLEAAARYKGKRYPLRFIIQNQARHLASFLRGDCAAYEPFQAGW